MYWAKKRKKIFFILASSLFCFSIQAIGRLTSLGLTGLIGCVCIGYGDVISKKGIDPFFVAVAGIMITGVSYRVLYRATPEGILDQADSLLKKLSAHKFAVTSFSNEELFFDTVHDVYLIDDLPLISAYNTLISLVPIAHSALSLINKACSHQAGNNSLLQERCDLSHNIAKRFFKNISQAIRQIRAHKDYLPQLRIYKEFLLNQKQFFIWE